MWTNIFRIGDLQTVSWFQLLPCESDPNSLSEKSLKAELKDGATHMVLSAHLRLQHEGFLSSWTNSFVGPWDPSQGVHNPDEKVKLWLFLPGRHSSVTEIAQATLSRLRVVANGIWLAPGDSEEVAVALSQALRNSIERALKTLSYVRFGDAFTRCHSYAQSERNFRRVQPTIEFVFAATEEAVYVHAVISAKHIRGLCSDDMERVLRYHSSNSIWEGLPVIVAPNGMQGRLTGCCPSDLVKQVYTSKHRAPNGLSVGNPVHIQRSSGCKLRGQSCYAEVALGCPSTYGDISSEWNGNPSKDTDHTHTEEFQMSVGTGQLKQGLTDRFPILERTLIYSAETVLVPLMHRAFARTSLKRFCLQNGVETSPFESWPLWNISATSHIEHCFDSMEGLVFEVNGMRQQTRYNSSSNSITSSISSISSTSAESDHATSLKGGDFEADADSLTCRQSGLSSNDQFQNDGHKKVSKRSRTSTTDTFGPEGTVINADIQDPYKSVANNSNVAGVTNNPVNPDWDWDADDGALSNVDILLSEFGDFGDFFEDDDLTFGEPPGTAESQAVMHPVADSEDLSGSPCTVGMDIQDQKFSPVGFSSLEAFNQSFAALTDDTRNSSMEIMKDARPSGAGSHSSMPSAGKFDHLTKAEAMMTFAPEYASVETPASEFSISIFRNPYLPSSKRSERSDWSSSAYVYNAAAPSSVIEISQGKTEMYTKLEAGANVHDVKSSINPGKLYTQVHGKMEKFDKRLLKNDSPLFKGDVPSSMSGSNSSNGIISYSKENDSSFEAGHFLLSLKPALASEIECIMFQAAMCRIRHTLLSISTKVPSGLSNATGYPIQSLVPGVTSTVPEMLLNKYTAKKKDLIPVRLAGDVDSGMVDGPVSAPVGVWRSVGIPKGGSLSNTRIYENPSSLPPNILTDEDLDGSGQRASLQELLDAMVFLVQQSTSFVDISLDTDDGSGCYCWLALQEQRRRGFACGPSLVHAGCGGLLATSHYVDIAGVDLFDPLSADVQVSSVTSLLQSDIKVALKTAFGGLDGPLSVIDWCKGRSQPGDAVSMADLYSFQCTAGEAKDSASSVTLVGDPISPPQSTGGSSCSREGARIDESTQRRLNQEVCNAESEQLKYSSRFRPTLSVLPLPAILVGYQDDWLKTSVNCLQLWEKAPLEPYALPKPVNYYALCPNIDLLSFAAADFFQQLGTIYEACKLGTHSPQMNGGQVEISSGRCLPSGLVLVDCPDQVKVAGSNVCSISSTSDFFQTLSKGWSVKNYVKNLTKVLKDLKLVPTSSGNQKEISSGPSTVVYVVCPYPDPTAVLETLVECSSSLGSMILSPEKEKRSLLCSQVAKALKCSPAVDEAAASNVLTLSGFNVPKLVLQIVTVESILRVNKPLSELAILKDIAFTVYNKARRNPRAASTIDLLQSSTLSGRSQSTLTHATSSVPGLWKDCLTSRPGLTRESELDAALRSGNWDNSWQTSRPGGLNGDPIRPVELSCNDDVRYMFEPLFVLAEPGSVEHGISPTVFGSALLDSSNSKSVIDDNSGVYMQTSTLGGSTDIGTSSLIDGQEHEQRTASLHCSYGWTEDWRWLICIWTDSRGELLDSNIFPFGGISSRQDTKVLQSLFVQVLYQGCQILSCASSDSGVVRPRGIVITRIGCFFELECQEWQKAIYSIGGNEVKKWPVQLRRSLPDGIPSSANGTSLQQQDMGLIQERNLPSSPSPPFYSSHGKSSFMKGGLGQTISKKQALPGHTGVGSSRGLLNLVQSISLIGVSIDHSLHLILPADMSSGNGAPSSGSSGISSYLEGFSPVKSLGSMAASHLVIPSPSLRYLPPTPMQLPTCLTSESPPLAHLLHSKGSAIPLATGYVVSKAVPVMTKDLAEPTKEDWPTILAVSLVDHYGSHTLVRNTGASSGNKQRSVGTETGRDHEVEKRLVLESVAAELHSLSWMTASPVYLERRTALPFHCDMLLRLRRLLHYADRELTRQPKDREVQDM